ncbi:MAG: hypothetical protein IIT98_05350, partial [Kiritimatiellae bacterium]|nr:hypothetical protein [Kiritimatiellia bacterium]
GAITFENGGTLTFTGSTLKIEGAVSGSKYVFAEATGDGTFAGVPELDGMRGWTVRCTANGKQIRVVKSGIVVAIW